MIQAKIPANPNNKIRYSLGMNTLEKLKPQQMIPPYFSEGTFNTSPEI